MEEIELFLNECEKDGLIRRLRPISGRFNGRILLGSREYIDFSSNDYLGLSGHPKLTEAAKGALDKFGAGSTASRLLSGDLDIHHRLEERVARFKNKESAIVFNSGYQANIGIISSFCGKGDAVFSDRLNHASIIDGIFLSGARLFRFNHNDPDHLEDLLKKERRNFKKALIITETIFSMDGDRPPLKELADLKEKYDCMILVDEAHATGIYGENGSGVVEEEGLADRIDLIMGTFGKALGSFGAYLATSKKIADYLINRCRSFIYSTALPPPVIAANIASLEVIRQEPHRRAELLDLARYFHSGLKEAGFAIRGSSQIVPIIIGDNRRTVEFAEYLQNKGYWVLPIRPPTVPEGEARLRFSLTANHDKALLKKVIDDISAVGIQIV